MTEELWREANMIPCEYQKTLLVTLDDKVELRTRVFQEGMVIRDGSNDEFFRQFVSYRLKGKNTPPCGGGEREWQKT